MSGLIEEHFRIGIDDIHKRLKRSGYRPGSQVEFRLGKFSFTARLERTVDWQLQLVLDARCGDASYAPATQVRLDYRPQPLGSFSTLFFCPYYQPLLGRVCNRRVRFLYLSPSKQAIACRHCLELFTWDKGCGSRAFCAKRPPQARRLRTPVITKLTTTYQASELQKRRCLLMNRLSNAGRRPGQELTSHEVVVDLYYRQAFGEIAIDDAEKELNTPTPRAPAAPG